VAKENLETLRKKLNDMIVEESVDKEELQHISEELDVVIVQHMREKVRQQRVDEFHVTMDEVVELLKKLQIFKKMYQTLRIVDPVSKKVLSLNDNEFNDNNTVCYEFWKRNQICENCISIAAYLQNDAIFKLEIKENSIYMILAIPIMVGEKRLILEMLKNTTDNIYLSDERLCNDKKLYSIMEYLGKFSVSCK